MNANEHRIGFDCTCDLPLSAGMDVLALDGKGDIPVALKDLPGYTLIRPGDCKLDAMQSMTPEEVELALATIGETQ